MKKIRINKGENHKIPCLMEIPENPERIVIMVHGFTSSKSCATAELLFRRLPEKNIGVVTYDQPGHGEEEAFTDPLGVGNCIESLRLIEEFVVSEYPDVPVGYFGSSFGAYITCLYISTMEHRGRKAFLRSAAVNMPELIITPLKKAWSPEIEEQLRKDGFIQPDLGLGATMKIPAGFIRELDENRLEDIFDNERFGHTELEFVHGSDDPVVNPSATEAFAKKYGFKRTVIDGEGHSICNRKESPDKVADLAIEFFKS